MCDSVRDIHHQTFIVKISIKLSWIAFITLAKSIVNTNKRFFIEGQSLINGPIIICLPNFI